MLRRNEAITMSAFFWPEFFILFGAAVIGIVCVMPYSLELSHEVLAKAVARIHRPLWVLLLLQSLQGIVLLGVATAAGLLIAPRIGLGVPLLMRSLAGQDVSAQAQSIIAPALILGVTSSVIVLVLEVSFFWPRLPQAMRESFPIPPLWKRLLASIYGGIDEEILLRLFLMSLLAWLIGLVWHLPNGLPTAGVFWLANVLAAVLFGLGHLPATAAIVKLTPLLVGRAIVLNGVIGVGVGYLYWRYGLEAAILAHFSADIVLHGIGDAIAIRVRARWLAAHQ